MSRELWPDAVATLHWTCWALSQHDPDVAIAAGRRLLEIQGSSISARRNLAVALATAGQAAEASELLSATADADGLELDRVFALTKSEQFDDAIALARAHLAKRPDDFRMLDRLAAALSTAGRVDQLGDVTDRMIQLRPSYGWAWALRGENQLHRGEHDEAIRSLQRAIELNPGLETPPARLSAVLQHYDRHAEAELVLRRAMLEFPDHPNLSYELGSLLLFQHRCVEAEAVLRRVVAYVDANEARTFPAARCNLGLALMHQGRYADAVPLLEEGHVRGKGTVGWSVPSAAWVRLARRGLEAVERWDAVIAGAESSDVHEARQAADHALACRRFEEAERLFAIVHADDSEMVDPIATFSHAVAALQLARVSEGDRAAALRSLGLDRLRESVESYARAREVGGPTAEALVSRLDKRLAHDYRVACSRDSAARAWLPPTERAEHAKLWDEFAAARLGR